MISSMASSPNHLNRSSKCDFIVVASMLDFPFVLLDIKLDAYFVTEAIELVVLDFIDHI
jgi:hypothetical protein